MHALMCAEQSRICALANCHNKQQRMRVTASRQHAFDYHGGIKVQVMDLLAKQQQV
jgi:hypothetical protein